MSSDVTIRVRDNGPLLIEGPVKILDAEGNEFARDPSKPTVALCRCGQSQKLPFCDGTHKTCGFLSCVRVTS